MNEIIDHPQAGDRNQNKETIIVSGSSGLIGAMLIKRLAKNYRIVGLDRLGPPYPPLEAECVNFDITDEKAISAAMERIRYGYGNKIASVIHLAAFYSFASKENPAYDQINVEGTRNFLNQLQDFDIDQFIFSSSDLIYKPVEPGTKIHEDCPIEANWGYPESKVITEDLLRENHGSIPLVLLRIAGVYNDYGFSIPISHQIKRIYENDFIGHFYPADVNHGDVYVHLEDVLDALEQTVEKRKELPDEIAINIGEPTTPTYKELQEKIGQLIHGKSWETYEVPPSLAKTGAWLRDLMGNPFIKPWMIDRAGEHYELDISRAKKYLDWEPKYRLLNTLPLMIKNLKANPEEWFHKNKLE